MLASHEVAAVINGLREAGVDDIIVDAAHRLDVNYLPRGIRMIYGRPRGKLFGDGMSEDVDGVIITGQHAMAGGPDTEYQRRDLGLDTTVGLFYRTGAEPYVPGEEDSTARTP